MKSHKLPLIVSNNSTGEYLENPTYTVIVYNIIYIIIYQVYICKCSLFACLFALVKRKLLHLSLQHRL